MQRYRSHSRQPYAVSARGKGVQVYDRHERNHTYIPGGGFLVARAYGVCSAFRPRTTFYYERTSTVSTQHEVLRRSYPRSPSKCSSRDRLDSVSPSDQTMATSGAILDILLQGGWQRRRFIFPCFVPNRFRISRSTGVAVLHY